MLSVILGLEKYHHLLIGKKLIIRSDSKMVQYLQKMKTSPQSRCCRWALKLSSIIDSENITFEFLPGHKNLVADQLSHQTYEDIPISESEKDLLDDELIALMTEYFDDKGTFTGKHFDSETVKPDSSVLCSIIGHE